MSISSTMKSKNADTRGVRRSSRVVSTRRMRDSSATGRSPRTRSDSTSLLQLEDNLGAADVRLTEPQLSRLSAAGAPSLGFPHDLLSQDSIRQSLAGGQLGQLDAPKQSVA